MTSPLARDLVALVEERLRAIANPEKAGPMAAYMRTTMPFYGVQKPQRVPIVREIRKRFPPASREAWEENVLALWSLPHREEKYIALDYAGCWPEHCHPKSLNLFRRLITEGAWWDLVDGVAGDLLNRTLLHWRADVRPEMDDWVRDSDLWIRRAALLSQLKHKDQTDEDQLFRHCLLRADEKPFFIRKAIGWALRDYSWTRPEPVRAFLLENRERLSALSFREGGKRLAKIGML